ncbi:MAG: hypothetical protein VST69_08445 [Nitrospirota bacterium]|nr:hypothetical protein [Nitrospirota bacterium]
MSNESDIAIILSNVSSEDGVRIFEASLLCLLEEFDFGFRGYGGVLQLLFDKNEFVQEKEIDDKINSVTEIDTALIKKLIARYQWLSIGGSIRIPEVDHLVDLDLILFPSFESSCPTCIFFRLEHDLYGRVGIDKNRFDKDAAEILLKLSLRFGTQNGVTAFQTRLIGDLDDLQPFNAKSLQRSILEPVALKDRRMGFRPKMGFINGIRRQFLATQTIKKIWKDCETFESVNGFSVLNRLIDFTLPL